MTQKKGLMETIITDSNELVMAIPNKELSASRLVNLSRIETSRLRQDVHFHYEDCQKLPEVLMEIEREICRTCPVAVAKDLQPPRAYFKNFADAFLEVEVDVRLHCVPESQAFKRARQEVLFAIDRAVKHHGITFAVLTDKLE